MSLPICRKEFQFEHASVIYRAEHSPVTSTVMPKLEVQVIDQYAYQRELSVQFKHRAGDSKDLYWEVHAYRHPGRRNIQEVSKVVAERFIERFLEICDKYSIFLFNNADLFEGKPRSKGFVQLTERLLDGETCSVKLLK
jgi:hypothetical protein